MSHDYEDVGKLPISDAELMNRLLSLSASILALKNKLLSKIAMNPDYERYNYYREFLTLSGIKIRDNQFIQKGMNRLKIQGYTIGVHGNSLSENPLSELSRLTMSSVESDKEKRKKDSMFDISTRISDKEIKPETSRNIELAKKRELEQTKLELDKIIEMEKELNELRAQLENERKRNITVVQTIPPENKDNVDDNNKNKKEKNKKSEK